MTNAISNSNGDMALDLPLGQLAAERDEQLVSAAKAGSDDAFAQLQHLYAPRLYSTIIRITKNHEDAEDVLQDTFLRVHLALCNFEGRSSFYSWVTRIAINSALMALRKRRARPRCPSILQWTERMTSHISKSGILRRIQSKSIMNANNGS